MDDCTLRMTMMLMCLQLASFSAIGNTIQDALDAARWIKSRIAMRYLCLFTRPSLTIGIGISPANIPLATMEESSG